MWAVCVVCWALTDKVNTFRQALQQYGKGQRPLDEGFDAMFQFDQPVPSGLAGQADLLAEEAITRNQGK